MDNNFNKKNKFFQTSKYDFNKQPFYEVNGNAININDELKNNYNSKNKLNIEFSNDFNPYNYELNYKNTLRKDTKGNEFIYYSPYNQQPGRGFGNLNINNNIRDGESTRNSTSDFRLFRESEIIDRFEYIDNRYANPRNIVFPFPRTGNDTRKTQIFNNNDFTSSNNINQYQFNTPNLNKKESTIYFDDPYSLEQYVNYDISNINYNVSNNDLPNKNIIKIINDTTEAERTRQHNAKQLLPPLNNLNNIPNIGKTFTYNNVNANDTVNNYTGSFNNNQNTITINNNNNNNKNNNIITFTNPTISNNITPTQINSNITPTQINSNITPTQINGNITPTQINSNITPTQINGYNNYSNSSNNYSNSPNNYSNSSNNYSNSSNNYSNSSNNYSNSSNNYSNSPNNYSNNSNNY